ncbi:threonine synthase [uncultured Anaerococcus sp.]|uniref:threonine synthase n=1 Tax=uncultured Anaerococcus sp. TaxID=293428 RepID=UPI0028899D29|nr:threonine synthase [uncultured Anaerococcus sp.]
MKYVSTRTDRSQINPSQAIIKSIADDGGLFVPMNFPPLGDLSKLIDLDYRELASYILKMYFDDLGDKLNIIVKKAYNQKFPEEVVKIKETNAFIMELYHGITHAFKDMALSILPFLLKASLEVNGDDKKVLILVATSGDTGKAALEGFKAVDGVRAMVFYPKDGVSAIQKLQMISQEGENLNVFAIKGNFDNAQTAVKDAFNDKEFNKKILEKGYELSSANSINIGRLIPQVVYYVYTYLRLVQNKKIKLGEKVNIAVPTGNFGNVLAAFYAKNMGLPVNKLIIASNDNKILTDFFKTGSYDSNRKLILTSSPSMDILISSNLERLLYHLSNGDYEKVAHAMDALNKDKIYLWDKNYDDLIYANFAGEEDVKDAIKSTYDSYKYLIDPHTAVAVSVYEKYKKETGDDTQTIIASTANPLKFPDKVLNSLGIDGGDDDFEKLEKIGELMTKEVPENLSALKDMEVIHKDIIDPSKLKEEVLRKLK